jgi:hypothetical protein
METTPPHPPVGLTVTPAPPSLQCPYCATKMLFLGCTPSEQCAEWICPACRVMKIRPIAKLGTFSDRSTSASSVLPDHDLP